MTFVIGEAGRRVGVSASALRLWERDALTFPSILPHRWRNDASWETRLLWINTPPTF